MKTPWKILLGLLWVAVAVLGAGGLVERLQHGHAQAAFGSYVVWGLWVSAYIYFIGLSAGSFLLSALIGVLGVRPLQRIGKVSLFLALVTLVMALLSVWLDLGRMDRFHRVFTSPNFGSMMAWMAWLYSAYGLLMLVELWMAVRPDLGRWAVLGGWRGAVGRAVGWTRGPLDAAQEASARHAVKVCAAAGIPLTIAFNGGVGALFGAVSTRPLWHTPLMPILFLTGALVSATALLAFVVAALWPHRDGAWREAVTYLGRAVLALLVFDVMLEWAEFSIPMWYGVGHEFDVLKRMLFGEFWWVFWVLHIALGTLVPVALLAAWPRRPLAVGLAGLLVAATFLTVRLNIVIPSLAAPHLQGLQTAFVDRRLVFHYVPSFFEWQVVFFVVAAGAALFFLGCKFLPLLDETPGGAEMGVEP